MSEEPLDYLIREFSVFMADIQLALEAGRLRVEDLPGIFDEHIAEAQDPFQRGWIRYLFFCRWLVSSNFLEPARDQLAKAEQEVRAGRDDVPDSDVLLALILADQAFTISYRRRAAESRLCQALETLMGPSWPAHSGSASLLVQAERATFESWSEDRGFAFAYICLYFARLYLPWGQQAELVEAVRWFRTGRRGTYSLPPESGSFKQLTMQLPLLGFQLAGACSGGFEDQNEEEMVQLWGDDLMAEADLENSEAAFAAALEVRAGLPIGIRITQLMQVAIKGTEIDEASILQLKVELDPNGPELEAAALAFLEGRARWRRKDAAAAFELLAAAWRTFDRELEPGHFWLPPIALTLAEIARSRGDFPAASAYCRRSLADHLLAGLDLRLAGATLSELAQSLLRDAPQMAAFATKAAVNCAIWFIGLARFGSFKGTMDNIGAEWFRNAARILARAGRSGEALHCLRLHSAWKLLASAGSRDAATSLKLGALPFGPFETAQLERLTAAAAELNRAAEEKRPADERRQLLEMLFHTLESIQESFAEQLAALHLETTELQEALAREQLAKYPNRAGDTGTIAFLCSTESLRVVFAAPEVVKVFDQEIALDELAQKTWELLRCLVSKAADDDPWHNFKSPAGELFDLLFAGIDLDELAFRGLTRLVIRPTGPLVSLPFCALFDGMSFLVERFSVVYDAHFPLDFARQPLKPARVALLGASFDSEIVPFDGLRPLPGAAAEVAYLRESFAAELEECGEVFACSDAAFDAGALTAALSGGYQIVHLATHFQSNPADPSKSTILLGDRTALSLEEIDLLAPRLDQVELIVLSGCTSITENAGADVKIHSSAELLHRLGARAVVGSFWSVDDVSTAQLMREFYCRMFDGDGPVAKDVALREAQLVLLADERFSHPYYWAAFGLSGNWLGFGPS